MLVAARELFTTTGYAGSTVADVWTTNSATFCRSATSGGRGPGDYAALVLDLWTGTILA